MLSPVEVISIAQTVLERSTLTPRSRYGQRVLRMARRVVLGFRYNASIPIAASACRHNSSLFWTTIA